MGFLTVIASIGLMIWLRVTAHSKENQTKRLCILAAFGATIGRHHIFNIVNDKTERHI